MRAFKVGKDGKALWVVANYTPLMQAEDEPEVSAVVWVTVCDITESRQRLRSAEALVAAMSGSQGLIEFDLGGHVLHANEAFLKLTGYSLDEIKGHHHRMFVEPEEAASPAYRAFWNKLGKGEFDEGEYLRVGKGGRRVWMRASYNPVLGLDGQPIKVVKCCSDVTASKLQAMENKVRMDAVSASNAVVEMDAQGIVVSVNALAAQIIGRSAQECFGRPESDFMFDEDVKLPAHQEAWQSLRMGRVVGGEFRRKAADARLGDRRVPAVGGRSGGAGPCGGQWSALAAGAECIRARLRQWRVRGRRDRRCTDRAPVHFILNFRFSRAEERVSSPWGSMKRPVFRRETYWL